MIVRPSGAQLGDPSTERERDRTEMTEPVVSSTTTSETPSRERRIAAMRAPSGDQRGSDHWVSGALVVIGVTSRNGKITEIDILADPERLSRLNLAGLIN